MDNLTYIKPENISLKNHPVYNEKWVPDIIKNDPSILSLGENITVRSIEKIQPSGGRLDLLLEDSAIDKRYEVELQLGKTDETHIIRTIEYWDVERKRYPNYEHCAVIIAEEITGRFLNVISLFNGHIPLIALKINAIKINNNVSLVFTKVLDEITLANEDEDMDDQPVNREYWEKRAPNTIKLADEVLNIIKEISSDLEFNFKKRYIIFYEKDFPNNFMRLIPQKRSLVITVKLPHSEKIDLAIESNNIDLMDYNSKRGRYKLRFNTADINDNKDFLINFFKQSYEFTKSL